MRKFVLVAALMLVCSSTPGVAEGFGRLQVGISADEAHSAMAALGDTHSAPLDQLSIVIPAASDRAPTPGEMIIWNANYNTVICRGRVSMVGHMLDPGFPAFVRTARIATLERGQPRYQVIGNEGSPHFSRISATWDLPGGIRYVLEYTEIDGQRVVDESFSREC